jgi:Ca2+-binding RTX toxin-like protein
VNNVAPVLGDLHTTTIQENGTTTLSGTITDPGTLDSFKLDVNWGDPLSPKNTETYTFAAGTKSFELTHQYLDDNPSGTASDQYAITLTITDDDTGTTTRSTPVTANNVAPVLGDLKATPVEENGTTTLTGTITDPGTLDSFTLVVNWGDPLSPKNIETYTFIAGTKSFELTHQYLDDNPTKTASDEYAISLTITDDDTGTSSGSTTVRVTNVAPVITCLTTSAKEVGDAREGQKIWISASFKDVGKLDTHTAVIDWGDGTVSSGQVSKSCEGGSISGSHAYKWGGVYEIKVTLTDDDTGTAEKSVTAYITGAGVRDGVLQIVGTKWDDNVTVNQEKKGIKVHADFLGSRWCHYRTFDASGIVRIEIYLGKGDDHAQIAGNIDLPVFMDGGSGDDHLNAGRGPAVLIGGSGDDKLMGSPSDDRIYGGDGNDFIQGNGGNDVLYGDAGCDVIYGSNGDDQIYGGDGNDFIQGNGGNDVLYGDAGCDVIYGSKGNDQIHGGEGNDWISGGGGNDVLNGDAGCDVIYGSCGNDQIYGGEGGDWIFGEGGNDKLYGGSGNDRLFGGCGNDLILGEEGDDLLVGGGGSDTIDGGPGDDLIYGCDKKGPFWLHMFCGGKGFIGAFDSWISDFIDDIAKGHDHKPNYCFNGNPSQNNQNNGNSGDGNAYGHGK